MTISANSTSMIDQFSKDFRDGYLRILSQRHGRVKIDANKIYQEYIADKHHVHMNSTIWTTLSEFVKMLGRESYCKVEESALGWDVQYIDRDPKTLSRAEEDKKRKRIEVDDEERRNRQIAAQVAAAAAFVSPEENSGNSDNNHDRALKRPTNGDGGDDKGEGTVNISIAPVSMGTKKKRVNPSMVAQFGDDEDTSHYATAQVKPSHISSLMREEENKKRARLVADDNSAKQAHWLHVGIQVKIMNKTLADGKFYKRKGAIVAVVNDFAADILVDDAKLRLDQQDLETIIPKVGGKVLIVNGKCRGCRASLIQINVESYTCDVKVTEGPCAGTELRAVEFEDVSKVSK